MRTAFLCSLATALAACSSGGDSSEPIAGTVLPPELVLCQARNGNEHQSTEVILRTIQGLGEQSRLLSRNGVETGVRVSADGVRLVFARERDKGRESSREIYLDSTDGSIPVTRLTGNNFIDDTPTWSMDGSRILFSSDRGGGGRRLWTMDADGQNPSLFTDGGVADQDPDWNAATDRIVFSREEPSTGRRHLYLINGNGTGLVPLTANTAANDREPAFSPDGSTVAFSRVLAVDRSQLMAADLLTGRVTPLGDGLGEARFPRWSPQMDRLFVARSRPLTGLSGLRLYSTLPDGTEPLLLIPDQRFSYPGFDPLPSMPPRPPQDPTLYPVDLGAAAMGATAGVISMGSGPFLDDRDGVAVGVATQIFNSREVAAIELRIPLPVDLPTDVVSIQISVTAALRRTDADSFLRVGLRDFVEDRFDTVVELVPADTNFVTMTFTTSSLAHIDSKRLVALEVIGDFSPGAITELWVDQIALQVTRRVNEN